MACRRRHPSARAHRLSVALVLLVLLPAAAAAQRFQWPENPENLQVLPEDFGGQRLGEVMRSFTTALGVRCEFCHVGDGPDLSTFDFAADDKPEKEKARLMMRMVRAINRDHLSGLTEWDEEPRDRIEVTCITCHRSQTRPRMLEDVLAQVIEEEGVEAGIAHYHALREQHYGGFAYDFEGRALVRMADRLSDAENHEAAIAMMHLEIEMKGPSPALLFTLGRHQAAAGMNQEAIATFEQGMALAPEDARPLFQQQIDRLQEP